MNKNCLKGKQCPKCGSEGPFKILCTAICIVDDDGTDDPQEFDWSEGSYCECCHCGYENIVERFVTHVSDRQCACDPVTNCCTVCGVYHGDPCPDCGGRGFHKPECPTQNKE